VKLNNVECVKALTVDGACANLDSMAKEILLQHVLNTDSNDEMVRALVTGFMLDKAMGLVSASRAASLRVIRRWIAIGADVKAQRPLLLPDSTEDVDTYFLTKGPERSTLWTALHAAAWRGDVAIIDELLAAGAEVEAANGELTRPLHLAALNNHEAAVAALLKAGAQVDAQTKDGREAYELATFDSIKEILRPPKIN